VAAAKLDWTETDDKAVDTVRVLAMDAVQQVGNGHPGTAMSLAPAAYLLFQKVMRHNPADPHWPGRDRFVLSCGHSSLTLYLQLYLGGWGLEVEDLKSLRTWGSKTPGHPEYGHTAGVETTTGPLGQGIGNAVGMAMAARREHGLLDPNAAMGSSPFDHQIYALCSDGDIEEGVSAEASAIAGVQQLGNLTLIYDHNQISIEDDTNIALGEDVGARYEAYGWHVQHVDWTNGGKRYVEDVPALYDAIRKAEAVTDQPSFIVLHTIIAWPAPNAQNTGKAHGSALGADEVAATKKVLGFDPDQTFEVPPGVLEHTRLAVERGKAAQADWDTAYETWARKPSADTALFDRLQSGSLPDGWESKVPEFPADPKGMATRVASGKVINAVAGTLPELWGGSADLAGSNNTTIEGVPSFLPGDRATKMWKADPLAGRVLHFGIREHGMGAIMNGIAAHGGTRVFGGTFLTFSDYMRGAVRLAALMKLGVTYVWTHDSIGLGEDGPTHQPIEHLAALRAIPGLDVVRPADANETAACWQSILERHLPAGLVLSRQDLPVFPRGEDGYSDTSNVHRGGYVLLDVDGGEPDVVLIGTGSEVQLAVQARDLLAEKDIRARVVSMPCREWFDEQHASYRETVIPPTVKARVSVEAGIKMGWHEIVGDHGRCVSIEHYGASADYARIYQEFGVTAEAVANAAEDSIRVSG
jgi:transketolase